MKRTGAFLTVIAVIIMAESCSLSRKFLYFPQKISKRRIEYIRTNIPNVSEVTIASRDNTMLYMWHLRKDMAKKPVIIYFGGNAEEVSFNIEDFNSRLDVNMVLVYYRGYGMSAGSPSEKRLKSDAEEIYSFFKKEYSLPENKIYVMGRSLGSGIALHLAVEKNIPKVILITPYDSIKNVAKDFFPGFLVHTVLSDTYESVEIAPRLNSGTLLLVAEKDTVVRPEHAKNLYDAFRCDKKMVVIKNSGHNTISLKPEYWEAIRDYLK